MLQSAVKSPVLPRDRSLLQAQIARATAMQNDLLADPLVSLATAQAALGGISYSLLCRYIAAGRLKVFRIGKGKRRIRLNSLKALLAEGDQGQVTP